MKVWIEGYPFAGNPYIFSSKENLEAFWREQGEHLGAVDVLPSVDRTGHVFYMRCLIDGTPLATAREVEVDEYFINKTKENSNGNTKSD